MNDGTCWSIGVGATLATGLIITMSIFGLPESDDDTDDPSDEWAYFQVIVGTIIALVVVLIGVAVMMIFRQEFFFALMSSLAFFLSLWWHVQAHRKLGVARRKRAYRLGVSVQTQEITLRPRNAPSHYD